ncbi:MAG: type II toxin-antitoxin system VapC family toxin [Nocardioidaceae bacterium]
MTFVVDASVTMAWCFEDEASAATDAILDRLTQDEARVPALWAWEVTNVLLVAERRGRITEAQATRFVTLLHALPVRLDRSAPDLDALLTTGNRHGLSAYDAAYLRLAIHESYALATLDRKLQAAAVAAGVELLLE